MATVNAGVIEGLIRLKDEMSPAFEKAKKKINEFGKTLGNSGTVVAGAMAAMGAAAVGAAVASMRWAEAVGISSAKTAMSTQAVQAMMHVAKQTSVEYGALEGSITKMTLSMANSPEAFTRLGLSMADLKKMAPEEQFAAVADKIAALKSPTDQAAAASAIFGRSWADIAPILREGGDKVRELTAENDRLGLSMSETAIGAGRDLGDTLTKLSEVFGGLIRNLGDTITTSEPVHRLFEGLVEIFGSFSKGVQGGQSELRSFVDGGAILAANALLGLVSAVGFAIDIWAAFKIAVLLASTVVQQSIIWLKASADAIMHPTRALGIMKQAYADHNAATQRGIEAAKQEIQSNIDRHNKLALVEVQVRSLVKSVTDADGAVHKSIKPLRDQRDTLLETAEATKKAADEAKKLAAEAEKMAEAAKKVAEQWNNAGIQITYYARQVPLLAKGPAAPVFDFTLAAVPSAVKFATAFKDGLKGAMQDLPNVILGAIQGGGDIGKAIGAHLGGSIGKSMEEPLKKGLSSILGSTLGGALAALAPGLGSIIGSLGGKLLGSLFGDKERDKVNQLRDQFLAAGGGIAEMDRKAAAAGITLQKLWAAKNVKDYEAALQQVNVALGSHAQMQASVAESHEAARAAADRYGLTIEELGPKFANQKLDEMAGQLFQDYELLKASGADMVAVIEKMAPATNEWLQTSVRAGAEIQIAMKPMLLDMARAGTLIKENGEAYTEAEVEALNYAQTASELFKELIQVVRDLSAALTGIPNVHRTVTIDEQRTGGGGVDNQRPPQDEIFAAQGYQGWVNQPTTLHVAERGPEFLSVSPTGGFPQQPGPGGKMDLSEATIQSLARALASAAILKRAS